jgi:hypothetical protein
MSSSVSHCHLWSNEQLIDREVHHRRKIASYITGLTFSTVAAIEIPIVVPIAGFEAYKIHSHHKKLKVIREELTKRNLSPNEKKKRDILIPVTATAALHLVAIGIADAVNVVPDAMQAIIHEPIQQSFSLSVSIANNSNLSCDIYLLILCCFCY